MKLKSIAAILVAGLMVVSVPMVAMAADIKVQINDSNVDTYATGGVISNNVTVKGATAVVISTKNVKIDGNVTEENNAEVTYFVVKVTDEGSGNVEVTGNVTNEGCGDGVNARGRHTVNIGGSITTVGDGDDAIDASNGATVTAGSVEANGNGINAKGAGTTVNVTGLVKSTRTSARDTGIKASSGATVTAGSVEAVRTGVNATGTGTTVNVTGLVKAGDANAILAKDGAIVTAGSAVNTGNGSNTRTIAASGTDTTVVVSGSVVNTGTNGAIHAKDGATVVVGSVTSNSTAIDAEGKETKVGVHGDVSSKNNFAVRVSNGADVVVEGNADGTYGVGIKNSNANEENSVVVLGTINASKYGVVVTDGKANNYEVYAYEIKAPEGNMFVDNGGEADDTIAQHVYYIVKTGKDSLGSVSSLTDSKGNSEFFVDEKTGISYNLAKEGNQDDASTGYIVRVTEVPGYTLKSMSTTNAKAVLQPNADGTYTLFVPRGGGVTLDLVYEAIQKSTGGGGSAWSVSPTKMGSAEAPVTNGTWASVNGAFRYTVNGDTVKNAIATIQYKAADGNTYTGSFYFDKNGTMQTGWQQIDGVWYYFNTAQGPTQGMMLTNTTTPDGYQVGANGAWIH